MLQYNLPRIYMIHPIAEKVAIYPRKLDLAEKFTPDLILAWAERTKMEMDLIDVNLPNLV